MGLGLGSILGGVAGALGGLFGGIGKNKALNGMANSIGAMQSDNQNWYDRRYNEDATQRADAQRILTMTEDAIKRRNRAAAGTAAVMGSTQEAVAAEKEANNKMLADTMSNIAAAGERRKDAIEQQYLARKNALAEQLAGVRAQKKSALDIASDTIGGGASGILSGWGLN